MMEEFIKTIGSECSIGLSIGFSLLDTINITWYSLSYIIGFILGIVYIKHLLRFIKNPPNKNLIDDLLIWVMAGTILGGRLGYVLLYNPIYYFYNPKKILYVWEGGMSFHGALFGILIFIFLFTHARKINFFKVADLVACAAPIGIFIGRISNFLNGELWGKETASSFGIIFPCAGPELRHPSQLYEAFFEGLFIFIILLFFTRKFNILDRQGMATGMFCLMYSIMRTFIEYFYRVPDNHIGYIFQHYTMGMLLSFPLLIIGIILIIKNYR